MENYLVSYRRKFTIPEAARILLSLFKASRKIRKIIERRQAVEFERAAVILYHSIEMH